MPTRVELMKGAAFSLTAQYKENGVATSIPARYTECDFQVRDMSDESLDLIVGASVGDGITIDHSAGTISISIGATQTESIDVTTRSKIVKGQLRLRDPLNSDDVPAYPVFDVTLLPEVIDD